MWLQDESDTPQIQNCVVLIENRLGIFFGCIKPVLASAVRNFMAMLPSFQNEINRTCDKSFTCGENINQLSRIILMLNAEQYIAWNVRYAEIYFVFFLLFLNFLFYFIGLKYSLCNINKTIAAFKQVD